MFYICLGLLGLCLVRSSLLMETALKSFVKGNSESFSDRSAENNEMRNKILPLIKEPMRPANTGLHQYDYADKWWKSLRTIPNSDEVDNHMNSNVDPKKIITEDKNTRIIKEHNTETPGDHFLSTVMGSHHINGTAITHLSYDYFTKDAVYDQALDKIIARDDLTKGSNVANIPKLVHVDAFDETMNNKLFDHLKLSKTINADEMTSVTKQANFNQHQDFKTNKNISSIQKDLKRILGRLDYENQRNQDTFRILDILTQNISDVNQLESNKTEFNNLLKGFKNNVNVLKHLPGFNVSFEKIADYYNFAAHQFGDTPANNLQLDLTRPGAADYLDLPAVGTTPASWRPAVGSPISKPTYLYASSSAAFKQEPSQFIQELYQYMSIHKDGYFITFLTRLFHIISEKPDKDVRLICLSVSFEFDTLIKEEKFMFSFGPPFLYVMENFAENIGKTPVDFTKFQAEVLYHAFRDRKASLTPQLTAIIEYIDSLFNEEEGADLFKALEAVHDFPNVTENPHQVIRNVSRALFAPYIRLSGTYKRQVLIDSINLEIERINSVPATSSGDDDEKAGSSLRRLGIFNNKTRFDVVNRDLVKNLDRQTSRYKTGRSINTRTTNFYETSDKTKVKIKKSSRNGKSLFWDAMQVTKAAYLRPKEHERYKIVTRPIATKGENGEILKGKRIKIIKITESTRKVQKLQDAYPKIYKEYMKLKTQLKNWHKNISRLQSSYNGRYTKYTSTKTPQYSKRYTHKVKYYDNFINKLDNSEEKNSKYEPSTRIQYNLRNIVKHNANFPAGIEFQGTKAKHRYNLSSITKSTLIRNRLKSLKRIAIKRKPYKSSTKLSASLILARHKTSKLNNIKTTSDPKFEHFKLKSHTGKYNIFKNSRQRAINNEVLNKIKERSSYSDEEADLKFNLLDAMRHDKVYVKTGRKLNEDSNLNVVYEKEMHQFSDDSSEEVAIKSNIYKELGFNHPLSRSNVSDIVRRVNVKLDRGTRKTTKNKAINELSSYSNEEEVLKSKLKHLK